MLKRFLLAIAIVLAPLAALAQPVQQSGLVTPGHNVSWVTNGVVQDSGPSTNGTLTSLGITANNICSLGINSAPISGAFEELCFGAQSNGPGIISYQNFGGATAKGLRFVINGATIDYPAVPGGTLAPTILTPFTIGDASCFSDTFGTLKDCGALPGTGTVTNVASGTGLTGGPITSAGTIGLATIPNNDILANIIGSTAAPIPNTLTATIDSAIGNTRGSILERGASGWVALAPGAVNTTLTGNGAGADPSYVNNATVGSSKVLLNTAVASNSPAIVYNSSLITATYPLYEIEMVNIVPVGSGSSLNIIISENNCSSFLNSGYQYTNLETIPGTGTAVVNSTSAAALQLASGTGAGTNNSASFGGLSGKIRVYAPAAGLGHQFEWSGVLVNVAANALVPFSGGGINLSDSNPVNCIQINENSGNISSGTFYLYGIRGS